jgi:hypothetical protein
MSRRQLAYFIFTVCNFCYFITVVAGWLTAMLCFQNALKLTGYTPGPPLKGNGTGGRGGGMEGRESDKGKEKGIKGR